MYGTAETADIWNTVLKLLQSARFAESHRAGSKSRQKTTKNKKLKAFHFLKKIPQACLWDFFIPTSLEGLSDDFFLLLHGGTKRTCGRWPVQIRL